ncbi:aminoglycoside 3'-phosphotransferase-1 [Sphingomonas jejuensis]|uniref:Aminoglycoside 3'-phosphotransferase n=1 Tax=Sphingomonas jejuensis TaxID=904715 RepID=A0ABX0XJV4_9SPHN|nr:APH(3') family aminoglycoside O-phosphotransferase [Sphingomonas jejuensis]NJC33525.1 aminoglycoside 3'-phosphotransferase-1 [Sphingomonas jejuensis]
MVADDDAREVPSAPPELLARLPEARLQGRWSRDLVGESGASVYRLHNNGAADLYLKQGRGRFAGDVTDELVRLAWLGGKMPVPDIVHFRADADKAMLLTTAMPGRTAYQLLEEGAGPDLVDALAEPMRRLHAIPVDSCPFTADHGHRLSLARKRIDAGLVEEDDFDEERAGWSAEQVWDELTAMLPLPMERAVTHGDFSLDNLLIEGGRVVGCIDLGRVGVADPYQDLAILWNCLGEFGPAYQDRLFSAYGIDAPDEDRLRFHLMLDELF